MDVSDILAALKERALWTEARKIIVRAGLQAGQGWPRTLDRYAGADVPQNEADDLASGLAEHVLSGEKALRFYQLEDGELNALREYATEQVVEVSPFSEAFPCLIDGGGAAGNNESVLCASYDDDDGIFLVYSGIK
ncbi:hypothetical protein [uncultured Stenotrophomonas sp.]|uniref:hypothetical protein n=1 Tax=uncultured Stenotrophomonas sp. TaxID=165438 RepID=UPI0025FCEDF7|nr:hypothetical protein [uncultured Stenotrophomonas sp.]